MIRQLRFCLICGIFFKPDSKYRKVCSDQCKKQLLRENDKAYRQRHPERIKAKNEQYYQENKTAEINRKKHNGICVICENKYFGRGVFTCNRKCAKVFQEKMGTAYYFPEGLIGEKAYGWKGGISTINRCIRGLDKNKEWKKAVLKRDNFTCVFCGQKGENLQVDHIIPLSQLIREHDIKTVEEALKCGEIWDIENGRTLCYKCHRTTETWGNNHGKENN